MPRCVSRRGKGLQLHGVLKSHLKEAIAASTRCSCRRWPLAATSSAISCAARPRIDTIPFTPRCRRWPIDWLNIFAHARRPITNSGSRDGETGEETLAGGGSNGHEVEPIYGPTYLPRKFKTAIGLPGDNCVDLYANDLGLMAITRDGRIIGYNVLVGGGFGVTPSAKKTFPRWPSGWHSSRRTRSSTWPRRSSRCNATSAIARIEKSRA